MSILPFFLVLVVPFVVIKADEAKCCYPNQWQAEVHLHERKMYTVYVDFEKKKIVEDWDGKIGNKFVVYDLANNKRYRIRSGDKPCKVYDIQNLGNYAQCTPDGANHEDFGDIAAYYYDLNGVHNEKIVAVDEDKCLPLGITKTSGGRSLTLTYENALDHIENQDIFNVDVSNCH